MLAAGHHQGATFYQLQAFLVAIENGAPQVVSAVEKRMVDMLELCVFSGFAPLMQRGG